MSLDRVQLHVLYRDTKSRLNSFSAAVREGRHLDEAASFARFVIWSIAPLLIANPQPEPLPCDGNLLRSVAQSLLAEVQERWRTNDEQPKLELSELEAINRKLDLLAGHVARISPAMPSLFLPPAPQPVPVHHVAPVEER